eukprot:CAMPEP_0196819544 /NCGR_PEP_ID=MMETSP1362-20130617/71050_1 /TAXON_ID=163516 /ORGANISM="Leptocylindrus danicus, Strain CCMP1856" /LENGTH=839 /DNA_ID=CAMNT_0042198083 /DNA_START=125 /DNA_END=2641 /DNA_ORIENTATION=+
MQRHPNKNDLLPEERSKEDEDEDEEEQGEESSIVIANIATGVSVAAFNVCSINDKQGANNSHDSRNEPSYSKGSTSLRVTAPAEINGGIFTNEEPMIAGLQQVVQDELQFAMDIASTARHGNNGDDTIIEDHHNGNQESNHPVQIRPQDVVGIPGAFAISPPPGLYDDNDVDVNHHENSTNRPPSDEESPPIIYAELVAEEEEAEITSTSPSRDNEVRTAELVTDALLVVPFFKQTKFWCGFVFIAISMSLFLAFLIGGGVAGSTLSSSSEDTSSNRDQRNLLEEFFQVSGGANWLDSTGWRDANNNDDSMCTWHGVVCDFEERYVTKLNLPNNNLTGDVEEMIEPLLAGIRSLTRLDLKGNQIAGNFTAASMRIAQMGEQLVYMDFRTNSMLTGYVPYDVCSTLLHLDEHEGEVEINPHFTASMMESFVVRVDCAISCDCCNHDVLCSSCSDLPGWLDENGQGCSWYEQNSASCTNATVVNGNFSSAQLACCACNDGTVVHPARPAGMPSASPSVEPTTTFQPTMYYQHKLKAFYEALNGDMWRDNTNWLSDSSSACDWYGILCNYVGNDETIVGIKLNNNKLRGTLPSEIGLLTNLMTLELRYNSITGSLPTEIGQMTNLRTLNVQETDIGGTIPSEIGLLQNLERLLIHYDNGNSRLDGKIPSEIGLLRSLKEVMFTHTSLNGSIPSEIGQLSSLEIMYLTHNFLQGTISTEIGMLSELRHLFFAYNEVSGTFPTELGQLSKLTRIWITDNQMYGKIPSEIGSLKSLLAIGSAFNSFGGLIPSELGLLEKMEQLYLNYNNFVGIEMPDEICALRNKKLSLLFADCKAKIGCSCCTW